MQKIALVLAIAAVGEGLIALHLVRQLQAERENAQTLQARVVELERRVPQRAAGATFVAIPAPTSSPFAVVGQSAPAQPTPVMNGQTIIALPDQQQTREQMAASMERQRTLLKDPEYREALQTQQKMMLMRTSPEVARDLNLTADQLKVIEDENNADLQMHRLQLRMMQAQEAAGLPSQEDLEQRMILRGDVSATSSSN